MSGKWDTGETELVLYGGYNLYLPPEVAAVLDDLESDPSVVSMVVDQPVNIPTWAGRLLAERADFLAQYADA